MPLLALAFDTLTQDLSSVFCLKSLVFGSGSWLICFLPLRIDEQIRMKNALCAIGLLADPLLLGWIVYSYFRACGLRSQR